MRNPNNIFELQKVMDFLEKRALLKQYKKAKENLLSGKTGGLDFKERKPKKSGIWSFRINKQFRAIGYFDEEKDFIVFSIDNHQ